MAELSPISILRADQPAKTRRDFHPRAIALAEALASSTWENAGPVFLRGVVVDEPLLEMPKNFGRAMTRQTSILNRVHAALEAIDSSDGSSTLQIAERFNIGQIQAHNILSHLARRGRVERKGSGRDTRWKAA